MGIRGSRDFIVIGGLFALALAIGGAGVSFPLLELLLELCALAALAYLALTARTLPSGADARLALALAALVVALPALQLIPLPPPLWEALPGRSAAATIDRALGWSVWRPVTLDPEGTIRALTGLLAPVAVFVGCLLLARTERLRLLWLIVGFALIGAILGMLQLASGGSLTPYPSAHSGYPIGLFVNRNHNAALLLAAMPLTAALGAAQLFRGKPRGTITLGVLSVLVVLAIVVLATTSRMGLLLLGPALAMALVLFFWRRSPWRIVLPSTLGLGAVSLAILSSDRLTITLARFSSMTDQRITYWGDVDWALRQFGGAGTGFGTFVPVYQSVESLSGVGPQIINHAHNDYLELLLEGGVLSAVAFLLFAALVVRLLIKGARNSATRDRTVFSVGAAASTVLLLLCSTVDYPLRMPALSSVLAVLVAALVPTQSAAVGRSIAVVSGRRGELPAWSMRQRLGRVGALALIGAAGAVTIQAGISSHELMAARFISALRWAPWSTQAHERAATESLLRNDLRAAASQARAAVRLSPISAQGIRTLGLLDLMNGNEARGNLLMQSASGLGWRDPLTQLWAIDAAERSNEPVKAIERAEALLRQQLLASSAVTQLLRGSADPRLVPLLVERLAQRPAWRASFFESAGQILPSDLHAFATVVRQLDRTSAPLSAEEWHRVSAAFAAAHQYDIAQQLWVQSRRNVFISNGDFTAVETQDGAIVPEFWKVGPFVSIDEPPFDGANRALRVTLNQPRRLMSQELLLPPGTYTLTYRAASPGHATLGWRLTCASGKASGALDLAIDGASKWQDFSGSLTVPQRDCPIQTLALAYARGSTDQVAWVDQVALGKAAR